eukprot:1923370-Rhodomonas_salina.7
MGRTGVAINLLLPKTLYTDFVPGGKHPRHRTIALNPETLRRKRDSLRVQSSYVIRVTLGHSVMLKRCKVQQKLLQQTLARPAEVLGLGNDAIAPHSISTYADILPVLLVASSRHTRRMLYQVVG